MRSYIVYKHTCPNNQVYIGITSQKLEYRWNDGNGYRGSWFYRCGIEKFGWERIKHEILYENLSYEEALNKEHELILKYESWCPAKGYNDSVGLGRRKTLPVKVIDLNIVFLTAKRCSEYLNISLSSIWRSIETGEEKHGHIFAYACEDNCSFSDICII